MKKMKFISVLLSMLCAVMFTSCLSDGDETVPLEYGNPKKIIIGTWRITKYNGPSSGGHFGWRQGTVLVFLSDGTFTSSSGNGKYKWFLDTYKEGNPYSGGITLDGIVYTIISLGGNDGGNGGHWIIGIPKSNGSGYDEYWELEKDPSASSTNVPDSSEDTDNRLDDVVPPYLQTAIGGHMPIYSGKNPPRIEGTYLVDPFVAVYCQDNRYEKGQVIESHVMRFTNQNTTYNTIDYEGSSTDLGLYEKGKGAYISGSNGNFTAFFNTEGKSDGISYTTALVISGTKTNRGIEELYYAVVMVKKGNDPDHMLMDEGVYRVFKDGDGLSVPTSWNRARSLEDNTSGNTFVPEWTIYSAIH